MYLQKQHWTKKDRHQMAKKTGLNQLKVYKWYWEQEHKK